MDTNDKITTVEGSGRETAK